MAAADSHTPNSVLCNAGAGAAAGVIAATFVCPLDVIKTRLQVHGLAQLTNGNGRGSVIVTSLGQIFQKEGLRGMYRGLSPTVLALLPNWAVYFTMYDHLKSLLSSDDENQPLSLGANMMAAACAGAATAIATNPLWVVKTRLQTQGVKTEMKPYKGTLSALQKIAHKEGIRGLYSGLVPALAGISHVAIQFPMYEKIKSYLAKRDNCCVDKLPAHDVAVASSVSKIVASSLTYPHEIKQPHTQQTQTNCASTDPATTDPTTTGKSSNQRLQQPDPTHSRHPATPPQPPSLFAASQPPTPLPSFLPASSSPYKTKQGVSFSTPLSHSLNI